MQKRKILLLLTLLLTMTFFACNSPEYTSAKMYVQQGQLDKAEEFFLKALDIEPSNPEIPYKLANEIYQKQDKYRLAKKYFEESLKRGSMFKDDIENIYKYNWGSNFNEGVKYFNSLIKNETLDRDAAIERTLNHFSIAYLFDPKDENTVIQLVRSYKDLANNSEKAFEILEEGIANVKDNSNLMGMKADMLIKMEQTEEAKAVLNESLENTPDNLRNVQRLGGLYFESNQYDEAIALYQNALTELPDEKDLFFNLGILYIRMEKFEDANVQFQQVLAFDPNDRQVIEAVGDVYMNQKDYLSAEDYYRQLVDRDPMNPSYLKKLGTSLNGQKRYKEGMDLIKQAKTLE